MSTYNVRQEVEATEVAFGGVCALIRRHIHCEPSNGGSSEAAGGDQGLGRGHGLARSSCDTLAVEAPAGFMR